MTVASDLSGMRFGRLTAVERVGSTPKGHAVWKWRCDCGNVKEIMATNVKRGLVQSCGCANVERITKHGYCGSPTYAAWTGMKARASGNGDRNRKYYADRGISVCDRWLDSFDAFLADMGECPPGLTLERIDNDGHYEPNNCEWATRAQQSANTRRTHRIAIEDEMVCLAHACKLAGLHYRTAMKHMNRGMTAQQTMSDHVASLWTDYEVKTS